MMCLEKSFLIRLGGLSALAFVLSGFGVSAANTANSRDFEHPSLAEVKLKTLDVVVSVAEAPRVASERFEVPAPAVVKDASKVCLAEPQSDETIQALLKSLNMRFAGEGFDVRFHVRWDVKWPAETPLKIASLSSTVTVADLRAKSDADAVLVVRAVPIDSFFIDRGVGSKIIETPQGRERVRDFRPEKQTGRLLLGQAFLFDTETGIRLWSRQAPGYPSTNRLTAGQAFLKYGHVGKLVGMEKAQAAANNFVSALFVPFPKLRSTESREARAALRETDRALEKARQELGDRHPWALSVDFGWTSQSFALPLSIFEDSLPALDHATLAPNGMLRLTPQMSLFTADGWVWNFALPLVQAPSVSFSRTYFMDEPREGVGANARDRLATVSAESIRGLGLEMSVGPSILVRPDLLLSSTAGLFSDVLLFDVAPGELLTSQSIVRFGALLTGEITYLPSGPTESWFLTGRFRLRGGIDMLGDWLMDPSVSLGVGILL